MKRSEGRPTVVGLTGGIASGKSTAGAVLRDTYDFPVIDCDKLGHQAYTPGTATFKRLVETFGDELVAEDGSINRRVLGGKVFGKPDQMKRLTDIVWPEILRLLEEEIARLSDAACVFAEAAVLFEAGWDSVCDSTWCVVVAPEEAVARLKKRNNLDEEAARARLASQMSNEERRAKADVVIENNGTLEQLKERIKEEVAKLQPPGKL